MDMSSRLSELGYRLTPQRLMVVQAVEGADGHISAEEIYLQIRAIYPHMNISTVYRTLELLSELVTVTRAAQSERAATSMAAIKPQIPGSTTTLVT